MTSPASLKYPFVRCYFKDLYNIFQKYILHKVISTCSIKRYYIFQIYFKHILYVHFLPKCVFYRKNIAKNKPVYAYSINCAIRVPRCTLHSLTVCVITNKPDKSILRRIPFRLDRFLTYRHESRILIEKQDSQKKNQSKNRETMQRRAASYKRRKKATRVKNLVNPKSTVSHNKLPH